VSRETEKDKEQDIDSSILSALFNICPQPMSLCTHGSGNTASPTAASLAPLTESFSPTQAWHYSTRQAVLANSTPVEGQLAFAELFMLVKTCGDHIAERGPSLYLSLFLFYLILISGMKLN
jgi:hypothetical protein